MRCALGFVAHTGWAIAVAVGTGKAPSLLDRRRFELVSGGFEVAGVYHAAQGLKLIEAERKVAEVRREAQTRACKAIAFQVATLRKGGHEPGRCAIVGSRKAVPTELGTILQSHALVHAAEGGLYREALALGAKANSLEAMTITPDELDLGAAVLRDLGRGAGPPWGRDQKLAALAALRL